MSLDGIIGTTATAELDGNGRTTLITDGLQWKLVELPSGVDLGVYTGAGITILAGTTDKYIVNFTRPGPEATYAIRWKIPVSAGGGEMDESFETWTARPTDVGSITPTVDDIAAILRTRTKDDMGNEVGTFNTDTRPTDAQVTLLIGQAYDEVTAQTDTDLPLESYRAARSTIALRAAMLVELTYWPDQIPGNQSPYNELKELYQGQDGKGGMLNRLMMSINRENEEIVAGETPESNDPKYCFQDPWPLGQRTIW